MSPFPMQSAYSSVMRNILDFINFHKNLQFKLASEEQHKKLLESNIILKSLSEHINDVKDLDNISVYGIKIGIDEIEKTNNFVKHFTLEPPMTYYGHACFSTLDYIFYNGKINPIRSLNIPDVSKVAMDWGEMPNEIFPSDHLSLCVDFHILN
jgi:mRNA deadenylase 3'-5' endonuclease subunit Ccr4